MEHVHCLLTIVFQVGLVLGSGGFWKQRLLQGWGHTRLVKGGSGDPLEEGEAEEGGGERAQPGCESRA